MISIVDYGMGNLRSVQKGFEKVGHSATITSDPREIARSDKVVLPGVGAFCDAIAELKRLDLVSPLHDLVAAGKPLLGVCLGLQLLFETSYEGGEYTGLGILPGKVVRFVLPRPYKVPHMGWNQLQLRGDQPIFRNLADGAHMYFVHSYYVVPSDEKIIAAETEYGTRFVSAVARGNVFATQFHPEKSQADGLVILKNFAELKS